MKPRTRSFQTSARDTLRRSTSQKDVSGLRPRQSQGVRNRATIARFFRSQQSSCDYGFGRMGPRKRATPCGGSLNPVRPARQIETLACRFIKSHKETCHV